MRWFLLAASLCITTLYLVQIYVHDPLPPESGAQDVSLPLSSYGFGATKRLLVFNLTEIGSTENIDLSDKKFAKLTISDTSGSNTYTIGIEVKGSGLSERKKLNLGFEFWSPADDAVPCTSIATCDDDKEELFDFGEKYEDWVLRGGFNDQTMIRDAAAFALVGGRMQQRPVEVLFQFGDRYTYEGVYLLIPAIQRRLLEKSMNWDSGGKKEDCDDEDYDINKVSLLIEHTIAANGRKEPCAIFEDYSIKMRYPKCDFYDEADIAPCRDAYMNRTTFYASVLTWKNTSVVPLDLESFVDTYYAEMLMREDDYPFTSQYFFVHPDNAKLYSGPRWDYDRNYWRIASEKGWHLNNLGYYPGHGPMQIWQELGKNQEFIDLVKAKNASIMQNRDLYLSVLDTRLQEYKNHFLDREIERWGLYGKKRQEHLDIIALNYGSRARQKADFQEEVGFMKQKIEARSKWMQENIASFDGYKVSNKIQWSKLVLNILFPSVLILITLGVWVHYLVDLNLENKRMKEV